MSFNTSIFCWTWSVMIANIWSCTPNLPIWTASFKQLRFHNFLQHFRKMTHRKWLFPCSILLSCSLLVEALLAWHVCTKDLLLAESSNVYKSWGKTPFWGIFLEALRTSAPAGDSPLYYSPDKQKNHLLPHERSRRFATFIMSWLLVVEHFYRFIIDFYVAVITMKTDLLIFIYLIYLVLTTDCTTVGRFQRSYQL